MLIVFSLQEKWRELSFYVKTGLKLMGLTKNPKINKWEGGGDYYLELKNNCYSRKGSQNVNICLI